ncbi:MAG: T9SS C-terminal target domain-containing protein [Balneolaceae bacterium]|nr:MAG: T9SS C-terminal target domain-containing protein [Balneolaceae bacterium]
MKTKSIRTLIPVMIITAIMVSCIIDEVDQPESVEAGASFLITLEARTTNSDAAAKYGVVGIFLPIEFEVDSVRFSGTMGGGSFYELMNDSTSKYPGEGGIKTGWSDVLADLFGEQEGYTWRVFETEEPHSTGDTEEHSHTIEIFARAGMTQGEYGLGYVITESALDFTDDSMWGDSFDNMITVVEATSIERHDEVASSFTLNQNYPNPFNPTTVISYTLAEHSDVALEIIDINGRVVNTLVNGPQMAGKYDVTANMSQLPSAVYMYRLTVNGQSQVRKMTLLK